MGIGWPMKHHLQWLSSGARVGVNTYKTDGVNMNGVIDLTQHKNCRFVELAAKVFTGWGFCISHQLLTVSFEHHYAHRLMISNIWFFLKQNQKEKWLIPDFLQDSTPNFCVRSKRRNMSCIVQKKITKRSWSIHKENMMFFELENIASLSRSNIALMISGSVSSRLPYCWGSYSLAVYCCGREGLVCWSGQSWWERVQLSIY